MKARLAPLLRSMPLRLALGLVLLFALVSLVSLTTTYVFTARSFDQTLRSDLTQRMAGFRAAPNARALSSLVEAEARETDPERMVLSYFAPNLRHYGNAALARDAEGYHVVSLAQDSPRLTGDYLALTATLHGGQLTIARSRSEIAALQRGFLNILLLSLAPTVLIALSGGVFLARRSARNVQAVAHTLDRLTTGDLKARVGAVPAWSDDLAEIAGRIDQMAEAQESSVAAIKQVSSDIAHDLKTPIQRVAVHLDELSRHTELTGAARDALEEARSELAGIVSVFGSLLQIAQIEAGTPKSRFAPVDLAELVETCIDLYGPSAAETGHVLTSDIADHVPRVPGDRNLLLQLLANLVENALRHTPPGPVTVSLTHRGDIVRLSVCDTGPGIPEAERESVLRRLYRLDQSRGTPGSGLGLSLASVVARLHGAEIRLEDNAPGLRVSVIFDRHADGASM